MAVDHLAVSVGEHRDLGAALMDAAAHAINAGVVLTGCSSPSAGVRTPAPAAEEAEKKELSF
jgi:hypothetical protein